jgi:hypothetical protein
MSNHNLAWTYLGLSFWKIYLKSKLLVAFTSNLKILKPEDIFSQLKKFPLHHIILDLAEELFLETIT